MMGPSGFSAHIGYLSLVKRVFKNKFDVILRSSVTLWEDSALLSLSVCVFPAFFSLQFNIFCSVFGASEGHVQNV